MRNKILSLLVLLLTAASGAWADGTLLTTITASEDFQSGSKTFDNIATVTLDGNFYGTSDWAGNGTIKVTPVAGVTITSVKFISNSSNIEDTAAPFQAVQAYDSNVSREIYDVDGVKGDYAVIKIEVYGTAEPPLTVEWNASTKTGTFSMPGSNVVLTPQYAPTAKWDVVETVPQQPAALEGIIAGQDAAIVTAGQSAQGTVMYAVTTTAEAAPALTAFSATVPNAKDYDDATTLYVWYYIQGQDTPDGQQATEENTFNDSEICTTPLTVQVLTNKFDLTFNAANANTIEAGKATVTVGGTAATVTDGKLQGVKMGSEVKMTAKEGYKFRKVEVEKGAPATTVTWSPVSCYGTYTQDGVTLTPSNGDAVNGNNFYQFGDNTFTTTLGKFIKIEIVFESTTYTFDGWTKGTAEQYQPDPHTYPDWWENLLKLTWTGNADSVTIKGKDVFGIHRITFTIQ